MAAANTDWMTAPRIEAAQSNCAVCRMTAPRQQFHLWGTVAHCATPRHRIAPPEWLQVLMLVARKTIVQGFLLHISRRRHEHSVFTCLSPVGGEQFGLADTVRPFWEEGEADIPHVGCRVSAILHASRVNSPHVLGRSIGGRGRGRAENHIPSTEGIPFRWPSRAVAVVHSQDITGAGGG